MYKHGVEKSNVKHFFPKSSVHLQLEQIELRWCGLPFSSVWRIELDLAR